MGLKFLQITTKINLVITLTLLLMTIKSEPDFCNSNTWYEQSKINQLKSLPINNIVQKCDKLINFNLNSTKITISNSVFTFQNNSIFSASDIIITNSNITFGAATTFSCNSLTFINSIINLDDFPKFDTDYIRVYGSKINAKRVSNIDKKRWYINNSTLIPNFVNANNNDISNEGYIKVHIQVFNETNNNETGPMEMPKPMYLNISEPVFKQIFLGPN